MTFVSPKEKKHADLLRDIRRYVKQLAESKIALSEFFVENTYKDGNNHPHPCYHIPKKDCEFIAHKLTGTKGTVFTARYINRFHEKENAIKNSAAVSIRQITFLQEIKAAEHIVEGMNQLQKIEFYKAIYAKHGLPFDIQTDLCIEDKSISCCEKYRQDSLNAIEIILQPRIIPGPPYLIYWLLCSYSFMMVAIPI